MPDPDETRTITGWKTASRLYRRSPGLGWLLALLVVPLLLGLLGWGVLDNSGEDRDPEAATPEVTVPGRPAALSIIRNGNDITLSGDIPNAAAKTELLDLLTSIHGPDVNLVDNLDIAAGVLEPNLPGLHGVLGAAAEIPDFSWTLKGTNLTLSGTAPSEQVGSAVEAAATSAWPDVNVTNRIQVTGGPPGAPVPAPGGDCANLQADITALLDTPVTFETDGTSLTPPSAQLLSRIAEKITACPEVRVSVDGYTDNSGNDAINVPLSTDRAKAVADFLVARGVAGNLVTSQGHGSANPIAANDTAEGKAQNRRVEITVS